MKTYIVGNWKMNQTVEEVKNFFHTLSHEWKDFPRDKCEAWVAPQFVHLNLARHLVDHPEGQLLNRSQSRPIPICLGAQNCSHKEKGAFTGEVSPYALFEVGAEFVIIGHSERRMIFAESHELLREKLQLALKAGLQVIFCVGETLQEREQGKAFQIVEEQVTHGIEGLDEEHLPQLLLAYEPVWAIGTGKTATPAEAQEMHAFIKQILKKILGAKGETIPLLYGGSVKSSLAQSLLSQKDIHGALVGGASLDAKEFLAICLAAI